MFLLDIFPRESITSKCPFTSVMFDKFLGLPQIVLLTKVDKICPDVNADVTKTFTSSAVCSAVEKVANIMGLPRARVFPVKNYENETGLVVGINILVLEAMKRCLDLADDFIEEQV